MLHLTSWMNVRHDRSGQRLQRCWGMDEAACCAGTHTTCTRRGVIMCVCVCVCVWERERERPYTRVPEKTRECVITSVPRGEWRARHSHLGLMSAYCTPALADGRLCTGQVEVFCRLSNKSRISRRRIWAGRPMQYPLQDKTPRGTCASSTPRYYYGQKWSYKICLALTTWLTKLRSTHTSSPNWICQKHNTAGYVNT